MNDTVKFPILIPLLIPLLGAGPEDCVCEPGTPTTSDTSTETVAIDLNGFSFGNFTVDVASFTPDPTPVKDRCYWPVQNCEPKRDCSFDWDITLRASVTNTGFEWKAKVTNGSSIQTSPSWNEGGHEDFSFPVDYMDVSCNVYDAKYTYSVQAKVCYYDQETEQYYTSGWEDIGWAKVNLECAGCKWQVPPGS